jgi:hypothetical protein
VRDWWARSERARAADWRRGDATVLRLLFTRRRLGFWVSQLPKGSWELWFSCLIISQPKLQIYSLWDPNLGK